MLFLQEGDRSGISKVSFPMGIAKHAAVYGQSSKAGVDRLKSGDQFVLATPDAFPNQGGVPVKVDGKTIGAVACSGAASEIDGAITQAAIDAILKP